MYKTTLKIEGMMCGMCEAHINDAIRRDHPVKKVRADRKKNEAVILSEYPLSEEELKKTVEATGYTVTGFSIEEEQPKKGFGFFKK